MARPDSHLRKGELRATWAAPMIFEETELVGAYVLELRPIADERGFFAEVFRTRFLAERGITDTIVQVNVSHNAERGTLRGMHYQTPPAAETKIVRCVRGAVLDVAVDLRPASATYLRNVGVELSAENRRCVIIPEGFAHGFQTLTDDAEVLYMVTHEYSPEHEAGLRHDDPALGIDWPLPVSGISPKDAAWPLISSGVPIMEARRGLTPLAAR